MACLTPKMLGKAGHFGFLDKFGSEGVNARAYASELVTSSHESSPVAWNWTSSEISFVSLCPLAILRPNASIKLS